MPAKKLNKQPLVFLNNNKHSISKSTLFPFPILGFWQDKKNSLSNNS